MQCVLTKHCTKHCKLNEFLDLSQYLAFISMCFMFVLWLIFSFFKNSVLTFAQLLCTLVRSDVSTISSLSEP